MISKLLLTATLLLFMVTGTLSQVSDKIIDLPFDEYEYKGKYYSDLEDLEYAFKYDAELSRKFDEYLQFKRISKRWKYAVYSSIGLLGICYVWADVLPDNTDGGITRQQAVPLSLAMLGLGVLVISSSVVFVRYLIRHKKEDNLIRDFNHISNTSFGMKSSKNQYLSFGSTGRGVGFILNF